jgi:hypothetical protein
VAAGGRGGECGSEGSGLGVVIYLAELPRAAFQRENRQLAIPQEQLVAPGIFGLKGDRDRDLCFHARRRESDRRFRQAERADLHLDSWWGRGDGSAVYVSHDCVFSSKRAGEDRRVRAVAAIRDRAKGPLAAAGVAHFERDGQTAGGFIDVLGIYGLQCDHRRRPCRNLGRHDCHLGFSEADTSTRDSDGRGRNDCQSVDRRGDDIAAVERAREGSGLLSIVVVLHRAECASGTRFVFEREGHLETTGCLIVTVRIPGLQNHSGSAAELNR